ncbi:hypothetical protein D3C87_1470710 [compost metagenome]
MLVTALKPTSLVQRALLQRLQLAQHDSLAVPTQRQCAQVLGLGPDALRGVPDAVIRCEVEHCPHGASLLIDTHLLGKGEGPLQIGMQRRIAQQRRGFQQEIPLELVPRFKPVIHRPQRLFHQHAVLRIDKARVHGCA